MVEIGAPGSDRGQQTGTARELRNGGPPCRILQISANLGRIEIPATTAHQTENTGSANGIIIIVIQVGEPAEHVAVLMSKGTDSQPVTNIRDLIRENLLSAWG
ncbi:hypothetical protein SDC9_156303 [bioreactor metagenome]|uniref:Uncharacterized protein n=1 Tax=bioreactor metagenome TaxID=1076179 RepID=A0A645F3V2_9ZZZZ